MDLTPFINLIKDRCGLFFEGDRLSTLTSGIHARMSENGLKSHTGYLNKLLNDEDEFTCLINLLTVNETYFLREPSHFHLLSERLFPELLKKKNPSMKIRILSAGCSTGEEPYSAVIALMERHGRGIQNLFSVIGVDIDRDAISRAGMGIFGANSFRDIDAHLKKRYFKELGDGRHEIMDFVKGNVEFLNFNLLSDSYPNILQGMDIIFYRNVSIYFNEDIRRRIFHKLSQILNEGGYLIVSSTETLPHNLGILCLANIDGIFLYHKGIEIGVVERRMETRRKEERKKQISDARCFGVSSHRNAGISARGLVKISKISAPAIERRKDERRKDANTTFDDALSLAKEKRYEESLANIDRLIEENSAFIRAYALKVCILINLQRLEEAKKVCLKIKEMDEWDAEGYLLSGLISTIEDNEKEAAKRFKEALYIQPSLWPAHFYLAGLYHSHGEMEQACKEYKITVKLLEKGGLSNHGFTFFPISFPAEQIIHLCRHNLEKLKKYGA